MDSEDRLSGECREVHWNEGSGEMMGQEFTWKKFNICTNICSRSAQKQHIMLQRDTIVITTILRSQEKYLKEDTGREILLEFHSDMMPA